MNERIQALAEQAAIMTSAEVTWHKDRISWQKLYDQKFAELIVKECYALVDYENKQFIKAQFKEHFGVEE